MFAFLHISLENGRFSGGPLYRYSVPTRKVDKLWFHKPHRLLVTNEHFFPFPNGFFFHTSVCIYWRRLQFRPVKKDGFFGKFTYPFQTVYHLDKKDNLTCLLQKPERNRAMVRDPALFVQLKTNIKLMSRLRRRSQFFLMNRWFGEYA